MQIARRLPKYGDVIGVDRGLYQHYGIYVSPDCVIEYATPKGDFNGEPRVQEVPLSKFLNGDKYFVCDFSRTEDSGALSQIQRAIKGERYHLYSPAETVRRARKRLGETKYDLALNNCEHFAIWCKTGVSESSQVNRVLGVVGALGGLVLLSAALIGMDDRNSKRRS